MLKDEESGWEIVEAKSLQRGFNPLSALDYLGASMYQASQSKEKTA
jgi:hypothetical protein